MHFSIPYAEEILDVSNKKYHVYHIYINGVAALSCRYSTILHLHEMLQNDINPALLPHFPRKHLFGLSQTQLKERRHLLEIYLQTVGSDVHLSHHPAFMNFINSGHKDGQKLSSQEVDLDIFLMNGNKTTVRVDSTQNTGEVLEKFATQIKLRDDFVYYFSLFLMRKEEDGDISIVRQLQEFETPFYSLEDANKLTAHRIVVRKAVWDADLESELLVDKVALNLLYVQALTDLDRGWIEVKDTATSRQLGSLRRNGEKKEFIQLCRSLRYYGYIHLRPCLSDWPAPDTPVRVAAGCAELVLRVTDERVPKRQVYIFPVTRIRIWTVKTLPDDPRLGSDPSNSVSWGAVDGGVRAGSGGNVVGSQHRHRHELSFEVLTSEGTLKWVRVYSDRKDQIILLNMTLRAMVDELVMKKERRKMKKAGDTSHRRESNGDPVPSRMSLSSLGRRQSSSTAPGSSNPTDPLSQDVIGDEDL